MGVNMYLDGWVQEKEVKELCNGCKWKLVEKHMVECEQARKEFPTARKCFFYVEVTEDE